MIKHENIPPSGLPPSAPGPSGAAIEWPSNAIQDLVETIAGLRSPDESARFLRDLCTIAELQAMSARWQVAQLLDQGVHYQEIAHRTGASTATISRVSTWLRFGAGGYRTMLERRQAST